MREANGNKGVGCCAGQFGFVIAVAIMSCGIMSGGKVCACEVTDVWLYVGATEANALRDEATSASVCVGASEYWFRAVWRHKDGGEGGNQNFHVKVHDMTKDISVWENDAIADNDEPDMFEMEEVNDVNSPAAALSQGTHELRAYARRVGIGERVESGEATVWIVEVSDVNEDITVACVNEGITFTAHADPAGKTLGCVEWERRYRPNTVWSWSSWMSVDDDDGDRWTTLNTVAAGWFQYRGRNGSGDTWKESGEVAIVKVKIENLEVPNDFIALPDGYSYFNIDTTQETSTDMLIRYSIYPGGYSFDTVKVEVRKGIRSQEYNLSSTSGLDNAEVVTVEPEDNWLVVDDSSTLTVTLKGTETSPDPDLECTDDEDVDGKRLLYNIAFSPQAYINELIVKISGGDVGNKQLAVMNEAKLASSDPSSDRRVKWEGYDATISEPADTPYCVFPEPIPTAPDELPAPKHVVKEGDYQYEVEAKDKQLVSPPGLWLYQSHKVQGIPIYVRYNMTDSEL